MGKVPRPLAFNRRRAEPLLAGEERRLLDRNLRNLGEYAVASVIPRLRVRAPIHGGRWVPYAFGGFGMTYGEFNDGTGRADVDGKEVGRAHV